MVSIKQQQKKSICLKFNIGLLKYIFLDIYPFSLYVVCFCIYCPNIYLFTTTAAVYCVFYVKNKMKWTKYHFVSSITNWVQLKYI